MPRGGGYGILCCLASLRLTAAEVREETCGVGDCSFKNYPQGHLMDDNKQRALGAALSQIERQFGKGSIMRMGDKQADMGIGVISTGSLGLDVALGIGGLPRGRIVEIYGPESSGKRHLRCRLSPRPKKAGGTRCIASTPNTPWIPFMRSTWALTSMTCWSPSLIPVSRRSKLPTCLCVPGRSTW